MDHHVDYPLELDPSNYEVSEVDLRWAEQDVDEQHTGSKAVGVGRWLFRSCAVSQEARCEWRWWGASKAETHKTWWLLPGHLPDSRKTPSQSLW